MRFTLYHLQYRRVKEDGSLRPAFVGGALRPTGGVAQGSSKVSSRSRYTGEVANHAEQYIGTGITYLSDTVHINACECSGKSGRRPSAGTRRSTEQESSLFRATALEPTSEYGRPVSSGALRPTGMGQVVSKNTRRRTHVRWGSAPHGYGVCRSFFDTQGHNRASPASDKDGSAQVYREQLPRFKTSSARRPQQSESGPAKSPPRSNLLPRPLQSTTGQRRLQ